jgi:hypothetical protein
MKGIHCVTPIQNQIQYKTRREAGELYKKPVELILFMDVNEKSIINTVSWSKK